MDDTDLLTVDEAARYLRVSERTIRRWVASGKLVPVPTPGRIVRLRRSDIAPADGAVAS